MLCELFRSLVTQGSYADAGSYIPAAKRRCFSVRRIRSRTSLRSGTHIAQVSMKALYMSALDRVAPQLLFTQKPNLPALRKLRLDIAIQQSSRRCCFHFHTRGLSVESKKKSLCGLPCLGLRCVQIAIPKDHTLPFPFSLGVRLALAKLPHVRARARASSAVNFHY